MHEYNKALSDKLLAAIKHHADDAQQRFADRYSGQDTPLLIDAIDVAHHEPARWEGRVLANFSRQQNFLRLLDALGRLTGEDRWRDAARHWTAAAIERIADPVTGLFYWGGHSTYDVASLEPVVGNHELKCDYPYYPLLFDVEPAATRRFVEAFWRHHMIDWSTLMFNRHGDYVPMENGPAWSHTFDDAPVPLADSAQRELSFINTGSDLIVAAAELAAATHEPSPMQWALRLLGRYDALRDPGTGLAGYQFNYGRLPEWIEQAYGPEAGERAREHERRGGVPCRVRVGFRPPLCYDESINETTVLRGGVIRTRYGVVASELLALADRLGDDGGPFVAFVTRDLHALAANLFDEQTACFHPAIADGRRLAPDDMPGPGYGTGDVKPVEPCGALFLAYARAARHTGDAALTHVARRLAEGLGWRLDATVSGDEPWPRVSGSGEPSSDVVMGWLELHRAEGEPRHLATAATLGRAWLDGVAAAPSEAPSYLLLDDPLSLAMLHLAAALRQQSVAIPVPGRAGGAGGASFDGVTFDPKIVLARRETAADADAETAEQADPTLPSSPAS